VLENHADVAKSVMPFNSLRLADLHPITIFERSFFLQHNFRVVGEPSHKF